jgi:hypothetical protein
LCCRICSNVASLYCERKLGVWTEGPTLRVRGGRAAEFDTDFYPVLALELRAPADIARRKQMLD